MNAAKQQFVPKVHPATRDVAPDDPMTLHATPVAGDPEVMLRCVVQEYAWMGWGADRIASLFQDPFYPALSSLLQFYGEEGIRERIAAVLGRSGVLRFEESVREEPEPAEYDDEPELVQIRIPAGLCRERPPWRSESYNESDDDAFDADRNGTAQRPFPTELRNSHAKGL